MIVYKIEDTTGEVLEEYKNLTEAGANNSLSCSAIRHACCYATRGARAGGFRWIAVINKETNISYYHRRIVEAYDNKSVTLDYINERVAHKRLSYKKIYKEREEELVKRRPLSFTITCDKCLSKIRIKDKDSISAAEISETLNIDIDVKSNNTITLYCDNCNIEVEIERGY